MGPSIPSGKITVRCQYRWVKECPCFVLIWKWNRELWATRRDWIRWGNWTGLRWTSQWPCWEQSNRLRPWKSWSWPYWRWCRPQSARCWQTLKSLFKYRYEITSSWQKVCTTSGQRNRRPQSTSPPQKWQSLPNSGHDQAIIPITTATYESCHKKSGWDLHKCTNLHGKCSHINIHEQWSIAQTREHLFRHCSQWKDQQKIIWKGVGKATGWRAGRCWHVQVSELLSMEKGDKAVMDFLAAADVQEVPPKMDGAVRASRKRVKEQEPASGPWFPPMSISYVFPSTVLYVLPYIRRGWRVAGVEPRHLAGQPAAGGDQEAVILYVEWILYDKNQQSQRSILIHRGDGQPTTRPLETSNGRGMCIDPAQWPIHNYQLPGSNIIASEANWLQMGLKDETQSWRLHTIQSKNSN